MVINVSKTEFTAPNFLIGTAANEKEPVQSLDASYIAHADQEGNQNDQCVDIAPYDDVVAKSQSKNLPIFYATDSLKQLCQPHQRSCQD